MNTLPPGLRGLLAQRQMAQQEQQGQLGQIQGLLGIQNAMFEQELMPLKRQQLETAVADAQRKSQLVNGLLAGMSGSPNQTGGGQSMGGLLGAINNPDTVARLKLAGIDFTDLYKFFNTPQKVEGGSMTRNPLTGEERFIPKAGEGMTVGQNNQMSPAPGYVDTVRAIEGAREGAKAGFDIVQVPDGMGGTRSMTRAEAARVLGGQAPQATPQIAPQPAQQADPLISQGFTPQQAQMLRLMDAPNAPPMSMTVPASQFNAPTTPPTLGRALSPTEQKADEKRVLGQMEKRGELPQAELRVNTQLADIRRLTNLANEIIKAPALDRATGIQSYFPSVRGGGAANVEALVDSLKAQVSGMKLQAMRDASKTGGAVGQVTEKEWPRLESMIVALDREKMNDATFREKLSELIVALREAENNISKAYEGEYGSVGGQAPRQVRTRRFNPQTGRIE